MEIRQANPADLPALLTLYAGARHFMAENGNPTQWGTTLPTREMLEEDIAAARFYICEQDGGIAAAFCFHTQGDPPYRTIHDGAWLDDAPYGVVHRIASARTVKGAGKFCLNWCLAQCGNVRIDTHRNNRSMQCLLRKLGFVYCGIIDLENGLGERLAYQKRMERA